METRVAVLEAQEMETEIAMDVSGAPVTETGAAAARSSRKRHNEGNEDVDGDCRSDAKRRRDDDDEEPDPCSYRELYEFLWDHCGGKSDDVSTHLLP